MPIRAALYRLAPVLLLAFAACGEDADGNGNGDTLLTGFSGLLILIIVIWLIVHALRSRR